MVIYSILPGNIIIYKDANLNIFCDIENGTQLDTQKLNSNLFSID